MSPDGMYSSYNIMGVLKDVDCDLFPFLKTSKSCAFNWSIIPASAATDYCVSSIAKTSCISSIAETNYVSSIAETNSAVTVPNVTAILLLMAGDVELNPGPKSRANRGGGGGGGGRGGGGGGGGGRGGGGGGRGGGGGGGGKQYSSGEC